MSAFDRANRAAEKTPKNPQSSPSTQTKSQAETVQRQTALGEKLMARYAIALKELARK